MFWRTIIQLEVNPILNLLLFLHRNDSLAAVCRPRDNIISLLALTALLAPGIVPKQRTLGILNLVSGSHGGGRALYEFEGGGAAGGGTPLIEGRSSTSSTLSLHLIIATIITLHCEGHRSIVLVDKEIPPVSLLDIPMRNRICLPIPLGLQTLGAVFTITGFLGFGVGWGGGWLELLERISKIWVATSKSNISLSVDILQALLGGVQAPIWLIPLLLTHTPFQI